MRFFRPGFAVVRSVLSPLPFPRLSLLRIRLIVNAGRYFAPGLRLFLLPLDLFLAPSLKFVLQCEDRIEALRVGQVVAVRLVNRGGDASLNLVRGLLLFRDRRENIKGLLD